MVLPKDGSSRVGTDIFSGSEVVLDDPKKLETVTVRRRYLSPSSLVVV